MRALLPRWPWAALLAVALVAGFESYGLGTSGPWQWLKGRISHRQRLEFGIATDRIVVHRALTSKNPVPRVFVVGSSRANAGFRPRALPKEERPKAMLLRVTHAGIWVFEMRSFADELARLRPHMVVMFLSEFDISSPVQLTPHGSFGSWPAVRELAAALGPAAVWQHRTAFLRLSLEAALRSYRYRRVLQHAVLGRLRSFEFDERYPRASGGGRVSWELASSETPKKISKAERGRILEAAQQTFSTKLSAAHLRSGFTQIHRITRGPHADIHRRLIHRAIELLTDAGIRVLLVEPPLHPMASEIYDASIRQDFLAFTANLEAEYGIGFLPFEASGPYPSSDFSDLTHLNKEGGAKLTRRILAEIEMGLPEEGESDGQEASRQRR